MLVIEATNVNDAWRQACLHVRTMPREDSRGGPVYVSRTPVITRYARPEQRVLLDPVRDANPFLHLFESLWMLAGRDDARWLDQFVKDFSARFAEEDGTQHGAYGRRWRKWFHLDDGGAYRYAPQDQLNVVVDLLRDNPGDRQAVISMWDPEADLGVPGLRDRPCNTHIYLRVRLPTWGEAGTKWQEAGAPVVLRDQYYDTPVLDITVCCRSNDAVWGAYGANAVHMSILQEYLAARIGVGIGAYYQFSNNWHAYEATLDKMVYDSAYRTGLYPGTMPLVDDPDTFDYDLNSFLAEPEALPTYSNSFFTQTARPMFIANRLRNEKKMEAALEVAEDIQATDWRLACLQWLQRRYKR